MKSNPDGVIEDIKYRCQAKALQMRCLQHQKNARVMVEGNSFTDVTLEVFACCEQFRTQVYEELTEELYLSDAIGPSHCQGFDDFAL